MRKTVMVMVTVASLVVLARIAAAEVRVEKNVVYGMYSGLALLMDVHHPDKPNGFAVVVIPGSGFHAPQVYGATPHAKLLRTLGRLAAPQLAAVERAVCLWLGLPHSGSGA
jgi:hypothetical protein